jgi:hypothetical protein
MFTPHWQTLTQNQRSAVEEIILMLPNPQVNENIKKDEFLKFRARSDFNDIVDSFDLTIPAKTLFKINNPEIILRCPAPFLMFQEVSRINIENALKEWSTIDEYLDEHDFYSLPVWAGNFVEHPNPKYLTTIAAMHDNVKNYIQCIECQVPTSIYNYFGAIACYADKTFSYLMKNEYQTVNTEEEFLDIEPIVNCIAFDNIFALNLLLVEKFIDLTPNLAERLVTYDSHRCAKLLLDNYGIYTGTNVTIKDTVAENIDDGTESSSSSDSEKSDDDEEDENDSEDSDSDEEPDKDIKCMTKDMCFRSAKKLNRDYIDEFHMFIVEWYNNAIQQDQSSKVAKVIINELEHADYDRSSYF